MLGKGYKMNIFEDSRLGAHTTGQWLGKWTVPNGPMCCMVHTWALKGSKCPYFGLYACAILVRVCGVSMLGIVILRFCIDNLCLGLGPECAMH